MTVRPFSSLSPYQVRCHTFSHHVRLPCCSSSRAIQLPCVPPGVASLTSLRIPPSCSTGFFCRISVYIMDDGKKREFLWESGYQKTWSSIREDDSGRLVTTYEQLVYDTQALFRKRRLNSADGGEGFVRLGMMRHLILVLDLSAAMEVPDLKPNRLTCTLKALVNFVRDYFDQNPISQLGIVITSNRRAERLTELSGNPRCHLTALENLVTRPCVGEPSLQNALLLAESRLKSSLHHKEVVVIMGNMTTCDPGDIHQTIRSLESKNIRCSVISLAVEVFVYRVLAQLTGGLFHVVLDEAHLKNILKLFVPPPKATVETDADLIRMGFPHSETFDLDCFGVKRCVCHLNSSADSGSSTDNHPQYACPRCLSAYCELPVECGVCGLTLVAAPHLARAYHHLFPLEQFIYTTAEIDTNVEENHSSDNPNCCTGCNAILLKTVPMFRCPKCQALFCSECDIFLNDSVHSCPSCILRLT